MRTHFHRGFNRASLLVFSTVLWGLVEFIALQASLLRGVLTRRR